MKYRFCWSILSIFREPVCDLSRIDTTVKYWPTDRLVLSYDLQELRSYTQLSDVLFRLSEENRT